MSLLDKASLIVTPNAVKAGKLFSVIPSSGAGDLDVVRNTTATRVNKLGIIENVALNVPRIDYTDRECPVILIEPQRTNLITFSNLFTDVSWNKNNVTVSSNSIISPSGSLDSFNLNEGTSSNTHNINKSIITESSLNYSLNIFAKINTSSIFRLILNDNANGSTWVAAQFNLNNLTITTNNGTSGGVFISASIRNVGNGWYRCNLVSNIPVNGTALGIISTSDGTAINSADSRGRASYTGLNKSIYIYGSEIEQGSDSTSYIPTTTSAETRNADVATVNPPIGTIKINTVFEDNSTQILTTIPSTFTLPFGRIKYVLMQHTL